VRVFLKCWKEIFINHKHRKYFTNICDKQHTDLYWYWWGYRSY
jgi:hypothetical protein